MRKKSNKEKKKQSVFTFISSKKNLVKILRTTENGQNIVNWKRFLHRLETPESFSYIFNTFFSLYKVNYSISYVTRSCCCRSCWSSCCGVSYTYTVTIAALLSGIATRIAAAPTFTNNTCMSKATLTIRAAEAIANRVTTICCFSKTVIITISGSAHFIRTFLTVSTRVFFSTFTFADTKLERYFTFLARGCAVIVAGTIWKKKLDKCQDEYLER